MAIDYDLARQKVNELNRTAVIFVDMLNIREKGAIGVQINAIEEISLTPEQLTSLEKELKDAGDDLKTIAGAIKQLVTV